MERRLVAILAADIEGYSRLMGEDELGTLGAVRNQRKTLIEPTVSRHKGHIFKVMGDGILAEFGSVIDAVGCAVELQREAATADSPGPQSQQMKLRVGINLSDVIVEDGDLYGDGVNIAARLEQLAEPGGICISAGAFDQVARKLDLAYEDIGDQQLKNIAHPIHVYRIDPRRGGGRPTGVMAATPIIRSQKPSIAVLPLQNLNRSEEQEFLCDGLTQDITSDLSRFSNLFVIAAHSAFTFKGKSVKAQEVGRQLGVQYLLEGSVYRAERHMRINVQLIDTSDDRHIWAHRMDISSEELAQAQDHIVQKIIAMLAVRLDAAERERVLAKGSAVATAYECYLRGASCYSHESLEQLAVCRNLFEEATRLDPTFARAWGYLAYTTMRAVAQGWFAASAGDAALTFAKRAVQLDSFDYYNHWDLAFVLWNLRKMDQALSEYQRAVSLNPNDADLLAEFAETLAYRGEPLEAIRELERAKEINPFFPDWYRWNLGWALYSAHRYESSLLEIQQMSELPNHVRLIVAANYVRLGRQAMAAQFVTQFLQHEPDYTLAKLKGRTVFGKTEDEEHWLDAVRKAGLPE